MDVSISKKEYLAAKEIIEQYIKEQKQLKERYADNDILLTDFLASSTRAVNAIAKYNKEGIGRKMMWLSELVIYANTDKYALNKFKDIGKKTVSEIKKLIEEHDKKINNL